MALATACGLAALHLRVIPATLPGDGAAGGLVGVHIGQFLTHAFGFNGGNLFMAALLLAGVMLATGASWLTILDGIGAGTLRLLDWIGSLALAPLRWLGPAEKTRTADDGDSAALSEPDPAAASVTAPPASQPALLRAREWLIGAGRSALATASAWWIARRMTEESSSPAPERPDSGPAPLDAGVAESAAASTCLLYTSRCV